VRTARAWGAVRQLFFALSLAHEAVGATVPPEVLGQLRRHLSLLPFEEGLLRFLCLRAALIFETSQHVFFDWVLLDLIRGLLKSQPRGEVVRAVTHGVVRRLMGRLAVGFKAGG
jgi:hypothetical protein